MLSETQKVQNSERCPAVRERCSARGLSLAKLPASRAGGEVRLLALVLADGLQIQGITSGKSSRGAQPHRQDALLRLLAPSARCSGSRGALFLPALLVSEGFSNTVVGDCG